MNMWMSLLKSQRQWSTTSAASVCIHAWAVVFHINTLAGRCWTRGIKYHCQQHRHYKLKYPTKRN